ncbi:MAG TPA: AMIN domain-containing protein [Gemmatimonadales bacterium]|nr:AMIN domain-containing protein [Gemmatimonadales bacterium]
MKRSIVVAACLALGAASRLVAATRDGEVRSVTVAPASGKVAVVIDLRGAVEVQDFTLDSPARLVLDLIGARLAAPATLYDGQNRGGVKNIRYGQFRPGVVRVVIDLDALKDYHIDRSNGQVRVEIGSERTSFAAWTSGGSTTVATAAPAPAAPPPPVTGDPARVSTPVAGATETVDEYLALHRNEALQSQAPRINVQWDDADIQDVVAGFAAFSGRTIVVSKGITGKVTAEVKNQPWDLAFNAVLASQGLDVQTQPGGILVVVDRKDLARADSTVPVETRLVRVNYAQASSLVPAVQSIVSKTRGAVVADTTNNALVITDVQTRIDQIESFVKGLDIRTPQVSIQAKIILVDRTDVQSLGLQYDLGSPTQFFNKLVARLDSTGKPFTQDQTIVDLGGNSLSAIGNADQQVINPALKLIFSTALGNFTLTTFVQALQSVDLADVQAEPSVTTLDNRPAEVLVGDRVPIRVIDVSAQAGQTGAANVPRATVQFQQTGINLRVTPHVTANRQILMQLHAERSAVKPASVDIGFTFQTQQADAQVLVNDGETIVMGGLTETDLTMTKTGIPLLVDLPIVGRLFGFTSQTEQRRDLIILITPHIVDDLAAPTSRSN